MLATGADAELLDALAPTDEEEELLAFVNDEALRDRLLFLLLRAPVGEPVPALVNARMGDADAYVGARIADMLANAEYLPATFTKHSDTEERCFTFSCEAQPQLNRTYVGRDAIIDCLIEYFNKGMFMFSDECAAVGDSLHA